MVRFEKLFEPVKIGTMEVKNRIVLPPMWKGFASPAGYITKEIVNHYRVVADGGVGLVIVEATHIDIKESRGAKNMLAVYDDDSYPGLSELAECIQDHGAKAALQIYHAGRQTTASNIRGRTPVAPSPIPCKLLSSLMGKPNVCRELKLEEIEEIVEAFGEAARRVKHCDFNAVEIHGAHGYLPCSFLSPYTNKRKDIYGGNLEGRARFPLEVVDRVRDKVGKHFPLIYRLSGDEYVEGGLTLKETTKFAKMLENRGVDCLHVSAAIYESLYGQSPPIYLPRAYNVHLSEAMKKVVDIPVITVGGITTPDLAEKILREGKADLVAMGRALIADPQLPKKAFEGHLEDIRPCIRCNEDFVRLFDGKTLRCTVNFLAVGREAEYDIKPAARRKRVLVVGGGPAGLEAARVAALRGHDVTLCEMDSKLGGNLNVASIPHFKEDIRWLIDYLVTQVGKLGVRVELGKEVTAEVVKAMEPDALVIAVGATPLVPDIPGVNRDIVATAVDVLLGNVRVGGRVVVVGGGLVGCETALFLAEKGKKVTIVEMLEQVAYNLDPISKLAILKLLGEQKVEIKTGVKLGEVASDGVFIVGKDSGRVKLPAETVVLALGLKPRREVVEALRNLAPEVYVAGDCVEARKIYSAIHEGYIAGFKL